jgi:glycosyltransferase involved in cell wall biosynthesis
MTKVVYIVGGLPYGGIENSLLALAKAYKYDKRIDFHIINISGTGACVKNFEDAGLQLHSCGNNLKLLKFLRIDTVLRLRKLLKELNPDIIQTSHYTANYFGRLASMGMPWKVITHIRNTRLEKKLHRQLANKYLSNFTDLFLCVSKQVMRVVDDNYNYKQKPNKLLYDFIDQDQLLKSKARNREEFGLAGKKIIVSCGRIAPQKNIDKIVRAMPLVLAEFPDIHYLAIGSGSRIEEYQELARELGVSDSVTFLGYRQDVYEIMKMSDVYCMPSEFEGFGIAHLEAMAVGLPSVVSGNVHTLEFARDFTYVCDTAPESVAENIIKVLSSPAEAEFNARKGTETAKDFTLETYKAKQTQIYEELLG